MSNKRVIGIIGDDDGSLQRAIQQAQESGLIGEGFKVVGISTSMLGQGAGATLPANPDVSFGGRDHVCGGRPWKGWKDGEAIDDE